MAIKKSELYSTIWASCDKLRDMSQAIRQVPKFFKEVLAYDPPNAAAVKGFRTRGKIVNPVKGKKGEAVEAKMDAFDKALEEYFARQ